MCVSSAIISLRLEKLACGRFSDVRCGSGRQKA
jgi:hypothetical protein